MNNNSTATASDKNLLSAGVDINIPTSSALNLALGLCIPIVVAVMLLIFYKKV